MQPLAAIALVVMLHVVVPGASFSAPCTVSSALRRMQQRHYPRPCHASNPNSSGDKEHIDDPELLLIIEEQQTDSLQDIKEVNGTIILPELTNISQTGENSSKEHLSIFVPLIDSFLSIRKELYTRIRVALTGLITIITRSLTKTNDWVRDDAAGQLVSSALALVTFFIGVALFAAWNIQILGGKKWSGPAEVIVPTVRIPTSTVVEGGIKVQKANWKRPTIQTSYGTLDDH